MRTLPLALAYELAIPASAMTETPRYISYAEVGLSKHLVLKGYRAASRSEFQPDYPKQACAKGRYSRETEAPPTSDTIFFKYGGSPLYNGLCTRPPNEVSPYVAYLRNVRLSLSLVKNLTALLTLNLTLPETICSLQWDRYNKSAKPMRSVLYLFGFRG